jgi:[ribosomal protein S5]-alanine N-acetyltransferase
MAMNIEIETDRLRLRRRHPGDLEANLVLDCDPLVGRYIFEAPPDPDQQRATMLDQIQSGWPIGGGFWVVEWKVRPGLLGCCALLPTEDSSILELGYRLLPLVWGFGVTTEAARAALDHGFRRLGMQAAVATVHPLNTASLRVLAKLSFLPEPAAGGRDLRFRLERSPVGRI